ncbi:MAG TPA: SIMPL domain-containing protein, partial [Longimicrobium sp.]|nr:SIMPL domain-containing protein [Longimicrobium sp.]
AQGLGVTLGRVIDVSTTSEPRLMFMEARAASAADMAGPTPVEPGQQQVQATVNVTFAIN